VADTGPPVVAHVAAPGRPPNLLPALGAGFDTAGSVRVSPVGRVPDDVSALAYRTVAEALTNVRRHAPAAATVSVAAARRPGAGAGAPIRILLADDREGIRTAFRLILDAQPDMTVVAEAADGTTALELARHLRPDVVLADVRMQVSTACTSPGARGPARRRADPRRRGHHLRPGRVSARRAAPRRARIPPQAVGNPDDRGDPGGDLHISVGTVKGHLAGIHARLGNRNRVEIARLGLRGRPRPRLIHRAWFLRCGPRAPMSTGTRRR
jgi:hypothetical protein